MAPRNHTTPEQFEWLTSLMPHFLEHQNKKKLLDFWALLDQGWFTKWPEPGVAEAELEPEGHALREAAAKALSSRKSYLRNWYNNRSVNKKKAPAVFHPPISTSRSHQPVELYSRQFYKEKVQPLVAAEVKEKNLPHSKKLEVVKAFTRAAFEAEPEEIRSAIFEKASTLKAENAARRAHARESKVNTTPEGYAASIESVAYVLDSFVRDLATRTGWAFSVMGGGPDPVNGGRIQTISFHEGRNFLGATFKKAHVSFEESVLKPYIEFLNQVYPPEICKTRALTESADGYSVNVTNGGPTHDDVSDMAQDDEAQYTREDEDMSLIDPRLRPAPSPKNLASLLHTVDASHIAQQPSSTLSFPQVIPSLFLPKNPPTIVPPPHELSTEAIVPPPHELSTEATTATVTELPPPPVISSPSSQPPQRPTTPLLPARFTPPLPSPTPPLPIPQSPSTPLRPIPGRALLRGAKPRRRPGIQQPSLLQKASESVLTEAVSERRVAAEEGTWSKELSKAVDAAQVRAVKSGEAKVARALKAAQTKAVVNEAANDENSQLGRPQRIRRAAISKEVVLLTDGHKRKDAKENINRPNQKKWRTR